MYVCHLFHLYRKFTDVSQSFSQSKIHIVYFILIFRWSDVILINEMFANPKAERLAWVATSALVIHQIASCIWTYLDEHGNIFHVKIVILYFRHKNRSTAIIQPSNLF